MSVKLVLGDICDQRVDVIVNAANTALSPGGGVCGAIHKAAGPELEWYCRRLKPCPVGKARITPAFRLWAQWVIHAVGPAWPGNDSGEAQLLADAYESSFSLAWELGARSIAFPAISTGIFGYPLDQAARIAVGVAERRTGTGLGMIPEVVLVCFDRRTLEAYERATEGEL